MSFEQFWAIVFHRLIGFTQSSARMRIQRVRTRSGFSFVHPDHAYFRTISPNNAGSEFTTTLPEPFVRSLVVWPSASREIARSLFPLRPAGFVLSRHFLGFRLEIIEGLIAIDSSPCGRHRFH